MIKVSFFLKWLSFRWSSLGRKYLWRYISQSTAVCPGWSMVTENKSPLPPSSAGPPTPLLPFVTACWEPCLCWLHICLSIMIFHFLFPLLVVVIESVTFSIFSNETFLLSRLPWSKIIYLPPSILGLILPQLPSCLLCCIKESAVIKRQYFSILSIFCWETHT